MRAVKVKPPTLTRTFYDAAAFDPSWVAPGTETVNYGDTSGPRLSSIGEYEYNCPRPWPTTYAWSLMGLGAMPRFQLGYTTPTFNNSISPNANAYTMIMPGINRTPFGGT
jgi:hypothetical protein